MIASPVVSRDEAAQYLKCSVRQIDRMSFEKKLPKVKVGRRTVYRLTDLDNLIEAGVVSEVGSDD